MDIYEVAQTETRNGKSWKVQKQNAKRFSASGFKKKEEAVAKGVAIAKKNLAKLVIYKTDGTVAENRDYSKPKK